ncbi:MAG TPA: GNAT family N-acetyltransferase [Saprospiraceae bacterium]|nr:GNAT family N-acetyltransferase [Saprospiraceae bacterium]
MAIHTAHTDADILACWPVMHALRPHLHEHEFLPLIRKMMEGGYVLAYVEEEGQPVAAAGYRYLHKLYDGWQIYIDDLSTLPEHRGKGHASLLLEHVRREAEQAGCTCVTLDSGPSRHDAHRLYLNKGYRMTSTHFTQALTS